ncbi:MAG: ATP phosphoribosyltransferase regulatory subunit [Rhizobiaceae bacterium]
MVQVASKFADQLHTFFEANDCVNAEIGLLQPADPYLETAGEDFRRLMFLTSDQTSTSLCLRPEFTVPVCLHHLASGQLPVRYGYVGTVFRQREGEPHEFDQAGIEDLGNENRVEADIASLLDAETILRKLGVGAITILLGDQAIFKALLLALGLPKAWREKLGREFGDTARLNQSLTRLSGESSNPYEDLPADLVEHINSDDAQAVTGWITNKMRASGLPLSAGRTPRAIASRLMDKVELTSATLSDEKRTALEQFLAIDAPIEDAAKIMNDFEAANSLSLGPSLKNLKSRFEGIQSSGMDNCSIHYQASFGRRLDYYTGQVFEIYANDGKRPLVGGGRYDHLMSILGAESTVPAVGFSIWMDRLEQVVS